MTLIHNNLLRNLSTIEIIMRNLSKIDNINRMLCRMQKLKIIGKVIIYESLLFRFYKSFYRNALFSLTFNLQKCV